MSNTNNEWLREYSGEGDDGRGVFEHASVWEAGAPFLSPGPEKLTVSTER